MEKSKTVKNRCLVVAILTILLAGVILALFSGCTPRRRVPVPVASTPFDADVDRLNRKFCQERQGVYGWHIRQINGVDCVVWGCDR
jgi:hypothetical protein